ncbi:MAG: RNA ligase family protein [Thiolinea sp.]
MTNYIKYPRTPHLPWSPGVSSDDVRILDTSVFEGKHIVVTEKMDGENTSLYCDHIHARSLDSRHHPSRDWVKQLHGRVAYHIPQNWRVCGENLYALHSVAYQQLASYFYGFSIWDEHNRCLSWTETEEWFALLGIHSVPVLYQGIWDEAAIRELAVNPETMEGYVVRLANAFEYESFKHNVAKWVRPHHVQTDQHWMFAELVPNGLQEASHESP